MKTLRRLWNEFWIQMNVNNGSECCCKTHPSECTYCSDKVNYERE